MADMAPHHSAAPALSVQQISVRFAGVQACADISFDVQPGEILAVIGPNGAGKTTLINAITGAVAVEPGGSVRLDGPSGTRELIGMRPDRVVGLGLIRTFQNVLLIPQLTVRENVLLGRYVHQKSGILANMLRTSTSRQEARMHEANVDRILGELGLAPYADMDTTALAYGIRKRIELARALALQPKVLLLDEPVAGMSLEERKQMADYVRLARNSGEAKTILLIEHDMRFVMSLADRVLAVAQGRILAFGTPAEIQSHPKVLEAYLGQRDD